MPAASIVDAEDVSPLMTVLRERWVLTLATRDGEHAAPYATPLFYAVAGPPDAAAGPRLVFASRPDSAHGRHLGVGPTAAAAGLYFEGEEVASLRGVQLRGEVVPLDRLAADARARLREVYCGRHPGAAARLGPDAAERLYVLATTWAKLTDNRLGFGHKLRWNFSVDWSREGLEHSHGRAV